MGVGDGAVGTEEGGGRKEEAGVKFVLGVEEVLYTSFAAFNSEEREGGDDIIIPAWQHSIARDGTGREEL